MHFVLKRMREFLHCIIHYTTVGVKSIKKSWVVLRNSSNPPILSFGKLSLILSESGHPSAIGKIDLWILRISLFKSGSIKYQITCPLSLLDKLQILLLDGRRKF